MSKIQTLASPRLAAGRSARLLVFLLAFAWGFNWIAAAFALKEVPPWSLRFVCNGIGAVALLIAVPLSGRVLAVKLSELKHIALAGFFNVAVFNICSAFAQLNGATSRAVIITYSMPIWSTALAWLLLGERLGKIRMLALALCICGLAILVRPLFDAGLPLGVFFSLGCAFAWTMATIYIKWADINVDPLTNAAWQLTVGTLVTAVGMIFVEGYPHVWPIHAPAVFAILFIGLIGVGLAHFLWWSIVAKLPTITASLGTLLVPVVGVVASTLMLGERPTATDIVGFVMIFAAAACVLLQPNVEHTGMPE
ncbi:MAG TPA: DMT family transporter [Pseudolabrys sp.]|nr:DMT family transporter [Pseudolabrys sp.]